MVTAQQRLGDTNDQVECPKCHEKWIPRVKDPVSCPHCKVRKTVLQRHHHTDWIWHKRENI